MKIAKVDFLDLVLKIDSFEKRADILFDGLEQLLDCESPFLDDNLLDYEVDITWSPTPLSTQQLCLSFYKPTKLLI